MYNGGWHRSKEYLCISVCACVCVVYNSCGVYACSECTQYICMHLRIDHIAQYIYSITNTTSNNTTKYTCTHHATFVLWQYIYSQNHITYKQYDIPIVCSETEYKQNNTQVFPNINTINDTDVLTSGSFFKTHSLLFNKELKRKPPYCW